MNFFINKKATLPTLKLELINNGRNDFNQFMLMLQNSDIYFCMYDIETGVKKIAMQPASCEKKTYPCGTDECEEQYFLVYQWRERDTRTPGIYKGEFIIDIGGDLTIINGEKTCQVVNGQCQTIEGTIPNAGRLIVPIREELKIFIQEGSIKK